MQKSKNWIQGCIICIVQFTSNNTNNQIIIIIMLGRLNVSDISCDRLVSPVNL